MISDCTHTARSVQFCIDLLQFGEFYNNFEINQRFYFTILQQQGRRKQYVFSVVSRYSFISSGALSPKKKMVN